MKIYIIYILFFSFLFSCTAQKNSENTSKVQASLLMYCGITMVRPMNEVAKKFEEKYGIRVRITQGGSKDLYEGLKESRVGDLYFPGSASYRKNNLKDGLLGDFVYLGNNQASMVVQKNNPKKIKADLKELTREDLKVVICDSSTGSIGRETKKILEKFGNYKQVLSNVSYLTTDSKNLNKAIITGNADLIINWQATASFKENQEAVTLVSIDEQYAKKKKLLLIMLTFSKYPKEAKMYLEFAASKVGRAIFRKYGFE